MRSAAGTAQSPPRARHAVAMVCDARFLPYALYLARDILATHPERDFDVVVVTSEAAAVPPGLRQDDVRIVTVEGAAAFGHLACVARRSHAAYLRLSLPDLLPDYERIAYLDCDISVAIPGLGEFLDLDLKGCALGAVRDIAQWRRPLCCPKEMRRLGRKAIPYFNSGVMLIDTHAWHAQGISARCLEIARDPALRAGLVRDDQSIANFALEGRWCEVSPVWNWQWTRASQLFADMAGARLVHFIGPRKPWSGAALPERFTRGYAPFLERHFPDRATAAGTGARPDIGALSGMLLRHRLRLSATRRFLERFPTARATHPC